MVHGVRLYVAYGVSKYLTSTNTADFVGLGGGTNYTDGNWHHVVLTCDPTSNALKRYVDGAEVSSLTFTTTDTYTGALVLGSRDFAGQSGFDAADKPWSYYSGLLASFSYWTKTLSSAEVTEIYNNGKLFNLNDHSAANSIKLWWKMGENGDLVDYSGNGYTGTNVGVSFKPNAPTFDSKPYQLPFSKRFQVIRALDGNQTTTG